MALTKEEKEKLPDCAGVSDRGLKCKYKAKPGKDKCGRCSRKSPKPFKSDTTNPNGLNFGGRGWTAFLDDKIIELASKVLDTPDYFNMTQEVEYSNIDIALLVKQLDSDNGYPFDKWKDCLELYHKAHEAWYSGDSAEFGKAFSDLGNMMRYCNKVHHTKRELTQAMKLKGGFIQQQQAIKEKERMFVDIEKMLVFGATLIQVIDFVMPKADKIARKYRMALFSNLAPKFGFEMNKTNKLTQIGEGEISEKEEDNFIIDVEAEEIADLESDDSLDKLLEIEFEEGYKSDEE